MLEEATEQYGFYGIARLQFEIELREAVWEGTCSGRNKIYAL
jgi:hypothetical protein